MSLWVYFKKAPVKPTTVDAEEMASTAKEREFEKLGSMNRE